EARPGSEVGRAASGLDAGAVGVGGRRGGGRGGGRRVQGLPASALSSVTNAAMPALRSGVGSIATLTPNTWSPRWSSVWTLRGVYSARSLISTTRPENVRLGQVSTLIVARAPFFTDPSRRSGT